MTRFTGIARATTALAVGALSLSLGAGIAQAAPTDAPAVAASEPATSVAQVTGRGHIATDGCHYYDQGGTWFVDACYRSTGEAGGYGLFPVRDDRSFGTALVTFQVNDPTWTYIRYTVPGRPDGLHIRTLKTNPRVLEVEARSSDGRSLWITPAQQQTQTELGRSQLSPAAQQQLFQVQMNWIETQQKINDRILAPACKSSYNGCR